MRKRLLLLNLALVALIATAGWQLRNQWLDRQGRQSRVLQAKPLSTSRPPIRVEQPPQPIAAAAYDGVAQQMLFVRDRNPNVVVVVAPPKPLPAFPVSHGVMDLGGGPLVILSETPGGPHRSFSPGDKVGEFTLVAANSEEIELEFEGQRVKKKLSELKGSAGETSPAAAASKPKSESRSGMAAEQPRATAQTRVETTSGPMGPGREISGGRRACQPGDTYPAGTVMNGLRKVVVKTPFGQGCRWEPAQ